jgi:BirA family transcriptional regulator, biotin operon repressor / biotin---[acetyl-CoA-carboxylase] ligase
LPQQPALNPLGLPFIDLQSVDSTNNYALERVHAGLALHGEAFFAHEQWAGKGQRGKTWAAEKKANIILSVVIKPHPLQVSQQFQLSACISVAVREFFAYYAGEQVKIKWPNDLYWQDRKAGGILIENVIGPEKMADNPDHPSGTQESSSAWQWAVIGIGININQWEFTTDIRNPVSLKQITGQEYDVAQLARQLCRLLDRRYYEMVRKGPSAAFKEYSKHLYKKNEKVKLKKDNRVFETIIKDVSSSGQLIVEHAIEERFDVGQVEWIV